MVIKQLGKKDLAPKKDICKIETTVVDTMEFAPTLKSIGDRREENLEQRELKLLLVKLVNLPLKEEDLVFIHDYLGSFLCNE